MGFKKQYLVIILFFFLIITSGYIFNTITSQKGQCKTNKDCQPKEFSAKEVGKFFICQDNRCKTELPQYSENIVCQIKDDCPYGYYCVNRKCLGLESKISEISKEPQYIPCQTNDDCPSKYECIDGKCWGQE